MRVRDEGRRIVFDLPRWNGPVLFGFALGLGALAFFTEEVARWMCAGFGFLCAAAGVDTVLRVHRLVLDFDGRTWRLLTGYRSRARAQTGRLESLVGAVLTQSWESSSSSNNRVAVWRIHFDIEDLDQPFWVGDYPSEASAFAALKTWSRRLGVDAIDRTGPEAHRQSPEALDRPLAEALASESLSPGLPMPEAGSRLRLELGPPPCVLLPRPHPAATLFLGLFGAAFFIFALACVLAAVADWAGIASYGVEPEERWVIIVLGVIFATIGGALARASFRAAFGEELICDGGDTIVFCSRFRGVTSGERYLRKDAIERIHVARSAGAVQNNLRAQRRPAEYEIVVRTDERIERVGVGLSPVEHQWLESVLETMVRRQTPGAE